MRRDADDLKKRLEAVDGEAAQWFVRLERGLSPSEQDQFFEWLAANPLHGDRLNVHQRNWARLNKMAAWKPEHSDRPNPDLLDRKPSRPSHWAWSLPLAAAACLALVITFFVAGPQPDGAAEQSISVVGKSSNRTRLFDGSVLKVNEGSVATATYTKEVRRIILERGEAFFDVVRDPDRPFVVQVDELEIVAVGTAFNVKRSAEVIEIFVTEGRVRIDSRAAGSGEPAEGGKLAISSELGANELAQIALNKAETRAHVEPLTRQDLRSQMAWQHGPLSLEAEPLGFIVNEFNRLNETQMVVADPSIRSMRIGGSFHSGNVEGFVRLLELAFGVEVTHVPEKNEYHLRARLR